MTLYENETESEIDHKYMTQIDVGLDMDTNLLNIKCVSV